MNKTIKTLVGLVLLAAGTTIANGQTVKLLPIIHKAEQDNDIPDETIFSEDFSRFTAGTEAEPDTIPIIRTTDANYPFIDNKWFATPGWAGQDVYQAGGTAALNGRNNTGGFLMTPEADLSGELTITFRAKAIGSGSVRLLTAAVTKGGVWNPQPVTESSYTNWSIRPNSRWKDYTYTIKNTYGGNDCRVQINAQLGGVLIDDIKITRRQTLLASPTMHAATNFTRDGFTASWDKVAAADKYLLSVYRRKATSDVDSVYIKQDYSNLKVDANGHIEGMPDKALDGWTINLGQGSREVYTEGEDGCISAPYSLCLDNDNDTIVFPSNGGVIGHFDLKVKRVKSDPDSNPTIGVDLYDGTKWVGLTHCYVNGGIPDGVADLLLDYFIANSSFTQVRLTCNKFGDGTEIAIGDLDMRTSTPTVKEYAFENREVTDTFSVLTGLDPESDYYYSVRAKSDKLGLTSVAPESDIFAFGVSAPTATAATDVDDRGGYTANWEETPKAESYVLNTYEKYVAPTAEKAHVLLSEDFTKSTQGTTDDPVYLNNYSGLTPLDNYTDNPGWYGYISTAANGMIGGEDASTYGLHSELHSPELSTGNNGGNYTISVTASGYEGDYLLILNNEGTTKAIPLTNSLQTYNIDMDGGTDNDVIVFGTYFSHDFMIDKVVVTQDLAQGDVAYHLTGSQTIDGRENTSARVSGLEETANTAYAYDVQAVHQKDNRKAFSDKSDRIDTDVFATAINNVRKDIANGTSRVYDLNGRYVGTSLPTNGHGVYIIRQGNELHKIVK